MLATQIPNPSCDSSVLAFVWGGAAGASEATTREGEVEPWCSTVRMKREGEAAMEDGKSQTLSSNENPWVWCCSNGDGGCPHRDEGGEVLEEGFAKVMWFAWVVKAKRRKCDGEPPVSSQPVHFGSNGWELVYSYVHQLDLVHRIYCLK